MRRLRPCLEASCPELVAPPANRCVEHRHLAKDPARRKVYLSRKWKGMRRTVLREYPLCQVCGVNLALDVDHIVAMGDGGVPYDRVNLQALCRGCHSKKTRAETKWTLRPQ